MLLGHLPLELRDHVLPGRLAWSVVPFAAAVCSDRYTLKLASLADSNPGWLNQRSFARDTTGRHFGGPFSAHLA
jgi:hypothetical protein